MQGTMGKWDRGITFAKMQQRSCYDASNRPDVDAFHLSYCELTIALFPHTCTFDNITLHADNAGDMYQVA